MISRTVRSHLTAAACLLLGGCGVGNHAISPSGAGAKVLLPARVADSLLAAGDEDDEFTGLLTEPEPEPTPPEKPAGRAGRFGLRLGYLASGTAQEVAWKPTVCLGLYYRLGRPSARRTVYEFGVDYVSLEREDGVVSSVQYRLRGEMLFGNWNPDDRSTSFYFLGGGDLISENGTREITGETESHLASGVNLGLGIGSTKGTWDVRAVYSLFPGSGNLKGNVLVAAGFSF